MKNIILQIFDKEFVLKLLKERVLPKYPDFKSIKKIEIRTYKDNIWEDSYHVVVEFNTTFIKKDNKEARLPIVCTAHSEEPRKNVYSSLKFLWDHGFAQGDLTIPRPLFYSNRFRATFYRGIKGRNLYRFIRDNNRKEIERIVGQTALWFVKLHNLPTEQAKNFNKENSRIKTVIPGIEYILTSIKKDYPKYYEAYKKLYNIFLKQEKNFFNSTRDRWLIHGDAHPENIIKISDKKIAVIDFTDICLADFARDLGTFMQQLEFMIQRKIGDKNYIAYLKTLFLDNYLDNVKINLDDSLKKRINLYFNWTALRTSTFFLIKDKPEPERSHGLLVRITKDMKLDIHI